MEARAFPRPLPAEESSSEPTSEPTTPAPTRIRPSIGAVCSTQERQEQIRSLVPSLNFDKLGLKASASRLQPKASHLLPKKAPAPLASEEAWPKTFSDVASGSAGGPQPLASQTKSLLQMADKLLEQKLPVVPQQQPVLPPQPPALAAEPPAPQPKQSAPQPPAPQPPATPQHVSAGAAGASSSAPEAQTDLRPRPSSAMGSLAAQIYANAYVPSQPFQQHLATNQPRKRREGIDLDFLVRLEKVEAAELLTTAALYSKGSPTRLKGSAGVLQSKVSAYTPPHTKLPSSIAEEASWRSTRNANCSSHAVPPSSEAEVAASTDSRMHAVTDLHEGIVVALTPKKTRGAPKDGKSSKGRKGKKAKVAKDGSSPRKAKVAADSLNPYMDHLPSSLMSLLKAR